MLENLKKRAAILGGATGALTMLGFVLAGTAGATTADPGEDAITGFGDKVTTYGTAMIGVVVIGLGILLAVKYIRKAASKA